MTDTPAARGANELAEEPSRSRTCLAPPERLMRLPACKRQQSSASLTALAYRPGQFAAFLPGSALSNDTYQLRHKQSRGHHPGVRTVCPDSDATRREDD